MPALRCGGRSGQHGLTPPDVEEQPTAFHQVNGVELDVSPSGALAWGCGGPTYPEAMKVLEGLKAIEPGSAVPVAKLGLRVTGRRGLLLVFWKST